MWITLALLTVTLSLLAIWLGGFFLGLSLTLELALTLGVVIVSILVFLIVYVVHIQRATRLARSVIVPDGQSASDPKQRESMQALQQQVQSAIDALKRSRLGAKGGTAALYALPWYVIVGPPGAGKTTAIRHSGLTFPLDDAAAYRGSGGTRNCDWWFTNEAILLDTAGRYATSNQDQPEWLSFLDLLRKYRNRRPINGLIVALGIPELATSTEEQIVDIAKQMRARVDEVTSRLKVLVPVYVMFTKTDLIRGFSQSWDDLRKSERGQIWGMTFPQSSRAPAPGAGGTLELRAQFEREFDLLISALHTRTLRRLAGERSVDARVEIMRFPVEVAALRDKLATFLSVLFQKSSFHETPPARGVYFTCGKQDLLRSARVIGAVSSGMNLPPPPPTEAAQGLAQAGLLQGLQGPQGPQGLQGPQGPTEAKSFFLTDLFRNVMFPDQNLGGETEEEKRRQSILRVAVAGLAITLAVTLLVPALYTCVRNVSLASSTFEIATALGGIRWDGDVADTRAGESLADAEARLRQLDAWRETTPPQLRWGMYIGNGLAESFRSVYVEAVSRGLVSQARADVEDRLRATDASPIRSAENFNRDFDNLKLYLMLSDPSHMDPAWAAPRLVRQWELMSPARAGRGEALASHVDYLCEFIKRGEIRPWEVDRKLVARTRSILAQVPQVDRLYETLVRDANTEIAPIRREAIFYGSVGPFVKSRNGLKVAGAYTKQGWQRVKSLLGTEGANLTTERWVLDEGEAQVGDAIAKLRDLYFERYKNAWRDFMADLEIADPGNAEYAIAELNAMSEPEWPYLRLLRLLSENAALDVEDEPDDKGLLGKVTDKVKEVLDAGGSPKAKKISPVERAFRPMVRFGYLGEAAKDEPTMTGLVQWEALIGKLVGALTDFRDGAASSDPKRMNDVFQEAFRTTSSLMSEQDGFTRPLLSPLLMQPITLAWSNVVKDAGVAAEATWEVGVWSKWQEKLEGKYPFGASRTDAKLEDVLHFFTADDGGLWGFYNESLKATLDRNGTTFVPSRRFKSSIGYSAAFLDQCLKRGAAITDALYAPKAADAAVAFDVNLHSVSSTIAEVTFEIDGVAHTYKNEPEQWIHMTWPGKSAHGARLRVRGAGGVDEEIARPGDFGLFRLLDAGEVALGKAAGRAEGASTLTATWELRAAHAVVKLDLKPARNEHPLAPGFFKGYSCPRQITSGR